MATRRDILKIAPALAAFGATLGYGSNLFSRNAQGGYKALVCISLKGGNDCYNTLIPTDGYHYKKYNNARGDIAVSREALRGMEIQPVSGWGDGRQMALHPSLAPLKDLYNSGNLALALNVGPLVEPIEHRSKLAARHLPETLYSHSVQSNLWRGFDAEKETGWGGRLVHALAGESATERMFGARSAAGSTPFFGIGSSGVHSSTHVTNCVIDDGNAVTCDGLDYWGRTERARAITSKQLAMLSDNEVSPLLRQLALVASEIMVGARSGLGRQVFYCEMGGFDTHDRASVLHAASFPSVSHEHSLSTLAEAMASFQAMLEELGVADGVVTFTTSEFGRSLEVEGNGSGHGWGGHHFVMGKPVAPKSVLGRLPSYEIGAGDDAGQGRLIPGMSVEQYGSIFARWMGLPGSDLGRVYPAIGRFDAVPTSILA